MMRWNDGRSAGSWVAMALVTLAFLGVVFAALFAVGRADRSSSTGEGDHGSGGGRATLDERFTRDDIDAAKYAKCRDVLRSK